MIRIRMLREVKGLQQKELAIDLGVSQPTVSDWESGRKNPSARSTKKLADYFGVSTDFLLERENFLSRKNKIIEFLFENNMTVDDLSKESEVPSQTIWELATLKKTVGMRDCLDSISSVLSVDPAYLIGLVPDPEGVYYNMYPTSEEWEVANGDPYEAYDIHGAMEFEHEFEDKEKPTPEDEGGLSETAKQIMACVSQMSQREQETFLAWLQASQGRG